MNVKKVNEKERKFSSRKAKIWNFDQYIELCLEVELPEEGGVEEGRLLLLVESGLVRHVGLLVHRHSTRCLMRKQIKNHK